MGRLFLKLPCKDGDYEVPSHVRAGLFAKYSTYGCGIDVDRELAKMALWCEKNPASRPKNPIRFIENWLKKCSAPPKKPPLSWAPEVRYVPHIPVNGGGVASNGRATDRSDKSRQPGVTRPVVAPTLNGAAAPFPLNGAPPERALPVLALVNAAAPPVVRSANGPRTFADVLAPFKQAIRSAK